MYSVHLRLPKAEHLYFWNCGGSLEVQYTRGGAEPPGSDTSILHNDPDALQDHCVIKYGKLRVERETYP